MMQWRMAVLEEVAQVLGGGTPSRTQQRYFGGGIAWATPTDVTKLDSLYISETKETVSEEGLRNSSTKLMPAGAVLLTSRATIGFTAISKIPICTNQGFINFVCGPDLLPEYLAYWLRTQRDKMIQQAGGTTFKEIARGTLRKFEIPVPPLSEQCRIVDLLSRAEGIVRLRREAEKKAAELIPALFVNEFSGLDGSNYRRAEELCEFITKGTTPKASEIKTSDDGNSVPFLKVLHIEDDGRINFGRQPSFVSQDLHKRLLARSLVKPNDVLMNIVGPPLGRICLVSDLYPEWNINQALAIFRPTSALLPAYLFHVLRSPFVLTKILQLPVGVRQLNISLEQCRNILIPVPAIRDQERFVERASVISALQSLQAAATSKAQGTFDALLAAAFQN